MKYTRGQFTNEYYQLWEMGLLLPVPKSASVFSVKYRKNHFDEYSRVTLKAVSVSDALERACYAITYASPWRPEDIDLHAVYDEEENLLWIDEPFYEVVQKKNEFRGMERRDFIAKFGMTTAAILFGLRPLKALAGTTTTALSGTASGFAVISGDALFTTAGSYSWTVPSGVTSVCIVCVGGGGGGSRNQTYAAGTPGNGSDSYFNNATTVVGKGGARGGNAASGSLGSVPSNGYGIGGGYVGDGGGNGGTSLNCDSGNNFYGGGGAGGYSGKGGNGGKGDGSGGTQIPGENGSGGGGGGGSWGGGGGVGLYGAGANGVGSTTSANGNGLGGGGGSGGGSAYAYPVHSEDNGFVGGAYGGGGGGTYGIQGGGGGLGWKNNIVVSPGATISVSVGAGGARGGSSADYRGDGGSGAVRIIWGSGRSFPSSAS